MSKAVVVVGGGWAGCAAALSAARALGDQGRVTLLERTDMLLGLGLCGGIFRNNGRFVGAEECLALGGGGELVDIMDQCARHRAVDFPGHRHASLYDVNQIEPAVRAHLEAAGVEIMTIARVTGITRSGRRLDGVVANGDTPVPGDAFVDATGTAGPPGNCVLLGNGCAMCIIRCPSFGPRRGPAELAGVDELHGIRGDGTTGSFSGSCDLRKETLSDQLRERLDATGFTAIELPPERQDPSKLGQKACQQYNLPEYGTMLVLLDTGVAKMMSPYVPLRVLRSLPGLEKVRYSEPLAGGIGNAVRYVGMAPHGLDLRAKGITNLYCAGEKSGPLVGHTEAIVTGLLAGHNAARTALGLTPATLPRETVAGDFIAEVTRAMRQGDMLIRLTFAGSAYFERMRRHSLYTLDVSAIRGRVESTGWLGRMGQPLG